MGENTKEISPFSKLFQVGVVVRDLYKAIERLSSLGLGPFSDPTISLPPIIGEQLFRGKPLKAEVKLLSTKIGEIELELFEPVKGESPWQEFLDSKGEGIHHIAFLVDNIDEVVAKLTEQGADVILSTKTVGGGGGVYLDPGVGDIIIEFMQL